MLPCLAMENDARSLDQKTQAFPWCYKKSSIP
jgi:hypothetical protein